MEREIQKQDLIINLTFIDRKWLLNEVLGSSGSKRRFLCCAGLVLMIIKRRWWCWSNRRRRRSRCGGRRRSGTCSDLFLKHTNQEVKLDKINTYTYRRTCTYQKIGLEEGGVVGEVEWVWWRWRWRWLHMKCTHIDWKKITAVPTSHSYSLE